MTRRRLEVCFTVANCAAFSRLRAYHVASGVAASAMSKFFRAPSDDCHDAAWLNWPDMLCKRKTENLCIAALWRITTSSSAIAERPRAGWVSFGQKWKTIFCRHCMGSIFNHCNAVGMHFYLSFILYLVCAPKFLNKRNK